MDIEIPKPTNKRSRDEYDASAKDDSKKIRVNENIIADEDEGEYDIVDDILKIDDSTRINNYNRNPDFDLIKWDSFNKGLCINTKYPVFVAPEGSSVRDEIEINKEMTSESFKEKFFNMFPFMKNVDFTNIAIAGGCPCSILTGTRVKDIDVFIHGSGIDANVVMKRFLVNIIDNFRKMSDFDDKIEFARNKNCFTVFLGSEYQQRYQVQVIFRHYKSLSEIIHGFDLGSSAIAFDGNELFVTSLGKFAYMYQANIIDTTRRSTTYGNRLAKYFTKGFAIVAPNFDVVKLHPTLDAWTRDGKFITIEMGEKRGEYKHEFEFEPVAIDENKIYGCVNVLLDCIKSDYQDNLSIWSLSLANVKSFYEKRYDDFYFTNIKNSDEYSEDMSSEQIYDSFFDFPLEFFINRSFYDAEHYDYFCRTVEISLFNPDYYHDNTNLDERKNKQQQAKKMRLSLFDEIRKMKKPRMGDIPIIWKMENPGTQLTSSFNPIYRSVEDFYKEYYTSKKEAKENMTKIIKLISNGSREDDDEDISYNEIKNILNLVNDDISDMSRQKFDMMIEKNYKKFKILKELLYDVRSITYTYK
jgi:hypothetical protein